MIFKNTGKIIDDFYKVGPPAMPIYLLDDEKPAYLLNLEAKVKAIKRRLENRSRAYHVEKPDLKVDMVD